MRVIDELKLLNEQMRSATDRLKTEQEVTAWAKPFILKFCQICLPEHSIEFKAAHNPQDDEEEEKESMQD